MQPLPPTFPDDAEPPLDEAREEAARRERSRAARIEAVADLALDLASIVAACAKRVAVDQPAQAAEKLPALTAAFDRLARTIRQTTALGRKLDQPPPAEHNSRRLCSARAQVIRTVEDTIDARARNDAENLLADLYERLDDPDFDQELAFRPLDEVVNEICRDFGIAPLAANCPGKRRVSADIVALRRRAQRAVPIPPFSPAPGGQPGPQPGPW